MDGILPAAGQAMRLRRLPKFLLPCDDAATTLVERHIQRMEDICDVIWLPVRPDLVQIVHDLNLGKKVVPIPLTTKTMSETVLRVAAISNSNEFLLGMPDTIFVGDDPYRRMATGIKESTLSLALWKTSAFQKGKVGAVEIRNNKVIASMDKNSEISYPHHWGAMGFQRSFLNLLNFDMPHVGYGIQKCLEEGINIDFFVTPGQYFDCGTFGEYQRFINTTI